jgi:NitT/TauT family transport system substrate-binding protein
MGCDLTRREVLALGVGAGVTLGRPLLRSAWARELPVKASYFAISALIQYYAAKERGFFKAENIKLEDTFVQGHLVMQSVISGQVDVTMTNTLDIAKINLQGVGVKILYPSATINGDHPYAQLVVPPDSPIKTAKDLEGRRVAVATLKSGPELAVRNWLAANGANPDTVTFVGVGFDGIVPAARSKQFDAVYAIEPAFTIIKGQKRGGSIAVPHLALGSQVLLTAFIAREAWIDKNPEAAQAVVRALDNATQWLMGHPGDISGIVVRNTRIGEDLARQMIHPGLTRVARRADLQAYLDMAARLGHIPRPLDVCTLFSKHCPQEC